MFLYLENEILKNERITNEGRFVYMGLRCLKIHYDYRNKQKCEDVRVIHPQTIFYNLSGQLRMIDRHDKEIVRNGIMNLVEIGIISLLEESKDFYVLNIGDLYLETAGHVNYFTRIPMDNIQKLFLGNIEIHEKCKDTGEMITKVINPNRYDLCGLYLVMLATVNNACDYGTMVQKKLAEMANISERTTVSYIYYLEELELIFVYRSKVKVNRFNEENETYELVNKVNMYGHYWKRGKIRRAGELRDQELLDYGDGVEGKADARGRAS